MKKVDYIIIGGGIIGMTTARLLTISGAKVAIFDRSQLGMQSSWAAGGIISSMRPWLESEGSALLSEYSKKLYPKYVEELKQESGIDSEYVKSGLVIINKDHAKKSKIWASDKEINLQENIEHHSSDIVLPDHSVLIPDIAQVRPPKLLQSLRKSLDKLSVSIYENTEVLNIEIEKKRFKSVAFNEGKLEADSVIITAGAWSRKVLSCIGIEIDIRPIKGQMLCLKPDSEITKRIILDGGHYFIPRNDGNLLIGSTIEDIGFANETTNEGRQELLEWAFSMSPTLKKAKQISHWSGLRPSVSIGKPLIGKVPDFKNIYLNTGHFRKGILQAPASAQLIVDSISEKKSFMDINVFDVDYEKPLLQSKAL